MTDYRKCSDNLYTGRQSQRWKQFDLIGHNTHSPVNGQHLSAMHLLTYSINLRLEHHFNSERDVTDVSEWGVCIWHTAEVVSM